MTPRNHRKYNTELLEKYSKHFDLPKSGESNDFPVLKIEEDFDDIPMTNGTCKTISTQTSPINEMNGGRTNDKKGSSNSLWTSDEMILRSGDSVDEDTKSSTSSSACEETGGVISSGKSGKIYLLFLSLIFPFKEIFGQKFLRSEYNRELISNVYYLFEKPKINY